MFKKMKKIILLLALLLFSIFVQAQERDVNQIFQSAIAAYELKDYEKSVDEFSQVVELVKGIENLSDYALFLGACIFANYDNNVERTFSILNYLVEERLYSDLERIENQPEFQKLHNTNKWKNVIAKVAENKETLPFRNRENIKSKLLEAKKILEDDNGKHWGYQIWNDSLIVIDYDNTIYSLLELTDSKTEDNILYYKTIEPNILAFVNTTQKYEDRQYATVLSNYLTDRSSTIIHELFHLLQFKFRDFNGNPVDYLDETDARILLRLEYQALRNTLNAIIEGKNIDEIKIYLQDAVIFRKERQSQYTEYLTNELEIETLEGLANYTGFALSSYDNKYQQAIDEINQREAAQTYTRPFPYATGVAYGLIFDYLSLEWKKGLDKICNFAEIYETEVLKSGLEINEKLLEQTKGRNNFEKIYGQEKAREENQRKLIDYYTELLINNPTLKVAVTDINTYGRTYDMNSTLTLKDKHIVYSNINGTDASEEKINFGNFSITEGKGRLGEAGVLSYEKDGINYFVFPLPKEINGAKIIGEFYEIELNPNWKIIEHSDGNMEIVTD